MPKHARLSVIKNKVTPEAPPETVPQYLQQEGMGNQPSEPIEASDFDVHVGGDVHTLDLNDNCSNCLLLKNENRQLQNRVKTLREKLKNKTEDLRKAQTILNGKLRHV